MVDDMGRGLYQKSSSVKLWKYMDRFTIYNVSVHTFEVLLGRSVIIGLNVSEFFQFMNEFQFKYFVLILSLDSSDPRFVYGSLRDYLR